MDEIVLIPRRRFSAAAASSYKLLSDNSSEMVPRTELSDVVLLSPSDGYKLDDVTLLLGTYRENSTDNAYFWTSDDANDVTVLALTFAVLMSVCILSTIIGNVLVVLSIFTYKPLRGVQNFYIVSLACADLAVAIIVMPFHVANSVVGHWQFGAIFCNMWLTFDIFTCTASILNLCAIAVDRYYAIHDPINYAQKRTLLRVLIGIAVVWLASAVISIPPLFGWNSSHDSTSLYDAVNQTCQLTDERSYVIYSASGSFYIPLVLMGFVYANIYIATRARLRARAANSVRSATASSERSHLCRLCASQQRSYDSPSVVAVDNQTQMTAAPHAEETTVNAAAAAASISAAAGSAAAAAAAAAAEPSKSDSNGVDTPTDPSATPATPRTLPDPPSASPRGATLRCAHSHDRSPISRFTSLSSDRSPTPQFHSESFLRSSSSPRQDTGVRLTAPPSRRGRMHSGRGHGPADTLSLDSSVKSSQMSQFLEEKQRISLSKERRAARTMGIIMGAFVLCWLPFFLMYVIFSFCPACKEDTDPRVANFIVWLGYINSTLNPVIYTIFNVDFRRAFKTLLQGKCRLTIVTEAKQKLTGRQGGTMRNKTLVLVH